MHKIILIMILIPLSIYAMNDVIITIADAREQAQQERDSRRLRFAQERNELLKHAKSNVRNGMCALLIGYTWVNKMFCMNGLDLQPTMTDVYILGCSCGLGGAFYISGCCSCCKALMLKEE